MKNNNSKIAAVIASILAIVALCICMWQLTSGGKGEGNGVVTIEYVSADDTIVKSKNITFYEGESIVTLIEENFENVTFNDGMLISIEDYVTPTDWSSFIGVYVDDVMSNYGLADANFTFTDGTKISLKVTIYTYE